VTDSPRRIRQSSEALTVKTSIVLLFIACSIASGCGGRASGEEPSVGAQRDVARQFAEAIFRGQTDAAVRLLIQPHDPALSWLAKRAARPWKAHHASVRLPARRTGRRWILGYAGTRTHSDGTFEEVRGDIVIVVAASSGRTGVEFFVLRHGITRFGTHHDSLLLPSNR
jgi:hypothetical protein